MRHYYYYAWAKRMYRNEVVFFPLFANIIKYLIILCAFGRNAFFFFNFYIACDNTHHMLDSLTLQPWQVFQYLYICLLRPTSYFKITTTKKKNNNNEETINMLVL